MVALLVLLIVLVNAFTFFVFIVFSLIGLVFRLQTALLLVLGFRAEASLCLTHLVEFLASNVVIVFENFVLLVPCMLVFELFDDSIGLLLTLRIFEVVHVELIFEVINVSVLLDVDLIETFKFLLEAFVFFLVFGFHVFDTLKTFFSTLKFLLSTLDFVLKLSFVLA